MDKSLESLISLPPVLKYLLFQMSSPEFKAYRILHRQKLLDDEIKQDNGQEGEYFLDIFQHERNDLKGFD